MIDPHKIWTSNQLPSLPTVAVKLLELTRNPETELREIVALIKSDPALAIKVLKASNSSYFGFASKLTSIDRAVPLLGTTVVTSLALSFSIVEAAMTKGAAAVEFQRYWLQSLVQGAASETVTTLPGDGLGSDFFLAGLLIDIGRLAMLKTIREDYLKVLAQWNTSSKHLFEVEEENLGLNHIQVGVELMRHWGLPEPIQMACKLHHAPLNVLAQLPDGPEKSLAIATAVGAASGDYICGTNKGVALDRLRRLTGEFYGLSEDGLTQFLARVNGRAEEAGDLLSFNVSNLPDPSDLMAQASEQLAQLAMREHAVGTQAVARQKAVEQERSELQAQNQTLSMQALQDPLTRVYNRRYFDDVLAREVSIACRTASPMGVIFIDVDKFKALNDTHGHQFGDEVLSRIAKVVQEVLRSTDVLARYGGEEFVVLVNHPTEKGLQIVAERVRSRIESEEIACNDTMVKVTASLGAALTVPARDDAMVGQKLIAAADEAMYLAKQGGRNQSRLRMVMSESEARLQQLVTRRRFSRWLVSQKVLDVASVSRALLACPKSRLKTGELAEKFGWLSASTVETIVEAQRIDQRRFGEIAIERGLLSEENLADLLAIQQEVPDVLAARLVSQKLLSQVEAHALLDAYWAERLPHSPAGGEVEVGAHLME